MKRKNFVYLAAALLILNTVIRFILDFSGDYPYNVFGTFSIIIIPLLLSVVLITQHSNKTIVLPQNCCFVCLCRFILFSGRMSMERELIDWQKRIEFLLISQQLVLS